MEEKERSKSLNQRTTIPQILFLLMLFLIFHVEPLSALNVDLYDNWGFGSVGALGQSDAWVTDKVGSIYDGISWRESTCPVATLTNFKQFIVMGVNDSAYPVYAYCVNTNTNTGSAYDVCYIKNDTYFDESLLSGLSFPAGGVVLNETNSNWSQSDELFDDNNVYLTTPSCDNGTDGNVVIKSFITHNTSSIKYYGIQNENSLIYDRGTTSSNENIGTNVWFATQITSSYNILRSLSVYLDDNIGSLSFVGNATAHLRNELNGSDIESQLLVVGEHTANWYSFDITDMYFNDSKEYYLILECTDCTYATGVHEWIECSASDSDCTSSLTKRSTDYGVTWSNRTSKVSLKSYGDDGLELLGTSSAEDYYFINKTQTVCNVDGDSYYSLEGMYAPGSYVFITDILCSAYGSGMICDGDHDYSSSSSISSLPSYPCRLSDGFACLSSAECWHNRNCGGATTTYDGYCSGDLLNVETNPYSDGCNNVPVLGVVTEDSNKNCTTDGGFPAGYVCDPLYEYIERGDVASVYNDICKGGLGASCSVDGDCFTGLDCQAGFCGYDSLTVYVDNSSDNKVYENGIISFDPSLSIGYDIQYACWLEDGVGVSCYGNATQCNIVCPGASFDGIVWDAVYNHQFTSSGSVNISLLTGNNGLFGSSYYGLYCVSGGGTYCWSCFDNLMNDDETYIDWGGHCGMPLGLKCNNGVLDNVTNETEIDYGGVCGNCSGNYSGDDDYLFIREAGLIDGYPFNASLECPEAKQIQGFLVSFILIILSVLIVPLLFIIVFLVIIILFLGFNVAGLVFGGVVRKRLSKFFRRK